MKNFLFAFLFSLFCISAQSQNIVVHSYDEYIAVNSNNGDYFHHGAIVTNTSTEVIDVKVKRHIYSVCAVDSTHFDWDLCCTPVTLGESIGYLSVDPGDSISAFAAWCFGSSTGVSCTDSIRYTFFDNDDPSDSTSIVFKYVAGPDIGISETNPYSIKLFPNPVGDRLMLDFNTFTAENAMIVLYDISGQAVLKKELNASTHQVDVSTIPTGIYMCSILNKGTEILREKLVIKH